MSKCINQSRFERYAPEHALEIYESRKVTTLNTRVHDNSSKFLPLIYMFCERTIPSRVNEVEDRSFKIA